MNPLSPEVISGLRDRTDEPYPGYGPCPHCFESCGYVCEFGNDWNDGPYVHQTRIPCRECEGTGYVEAEPIHRVQQRHRTLGDLDNMEGRA